MEKMFNSLFLLQEWQMQKYCIKLIMDIECHALQAAQQRSTT